MIESQPTESGREDLALRVRAGDQVFCRDEHVGGVSLILLNPTGRVEGFVMHTGHLPGRNLIVPVAWVQEAERENVYLSVERWVLESLPDYRPDDALAADVDNALCADDILRMGDYHVIDVTVQDGIVRLRGHVDTRMNKSRAEDAARSVAGVLRVENHLVVDADLVMGVAQVLSRDDRTRLARVAVGARNGYIVLSGQVASAAVREAAEEVAASVPQVRVIINHLQAPNVVVDPQEQQVLEPPIGRDVYATHELLGHVERVIINPHNRRVTAFVAHGYYPDLLHMDERGVSNEIPQQERRVVVPISVMRCETGSTVLLNVDSCEAARYRDFNSADFVSPPEGWQPPYPYCWDDVLFERRP
jgi:osmotically-inducible protein OsmY